MKRTNNLPDFWAARHETNTRAVDHQYQQLVASGCIENFRIAAGLTVGWREGWFFADSDAYKWLEAAARVYARQPDPRLASRMDDLIALIGQAQMPDGYIFTYNQIHFPGTRWHNLHIEHELYCHGHLIEAGVSHFQATGRLNLLSIARKAADRVAADFHGKGPRFTPGHEEIELGLLRLHEITPGDTEYLALARQLVEQRGRSFLVGLSILRQNFDANRRKARIRAMKQAYLAAHPGFKPFELPPDNEYKKTPFSGLRRILSGLSGKYLQQHVPVRQQTEPVGHSVRFGYFVTAAAMLARQDDTLLAPLERLWERMVTRRMYVTGGLGSQPGLEGFGNDDELDPETAYAETCAALSSLFWSWELAQITGAARYSELFEWQLYNAAAVGMGLNGDTYFYNNPLLCRGGVERRAWYSVPCCPSNISRTYAGIEKYVLTTRPAELCIHQYFPAQINLADGASLAIESALPWDGQVRIHINWGGPGELKLRQPVWAGGMRVRINGTQSLDAAAIPPGAETTACGYDPCVARFVCLPIPGGEVEVEIAFDLPVRLLRAPARVKGHAGKVTVTRGPLVYCLESCDNPGIDLFTAKLDPASLQPVADPTLLGGAVKIEARTTGGQPLALIPYLLWGNRGPAAMTVWIHA